MLRAPLLLVLASASPGPWTTQETAETRTGWRVPVAGWDGACVAASEVEVPASLSSRQEWPAGQRLAGWTGEPAWRRWLELLRDERSADAPGAGRRLELALAARSMGRDQAAWEHLLHVRGDAPRLAAALPRFLPGAFHPTGASGPPSRIVLAPALPPPPVPGAVLSDAGEANPFAPEAEALGFEAGGARLSLRVVLEGDGTQVDVHHLGGPPVTVDVRVPVPPGVAIGALYVNWSEVEDPGAVPTVELSAEEPEATLWGRFIPHRAEWPASVPEALGAQLELGGLWFILPADDDRFTPHRRFAESAAELLGLELVVAAEPPEPRAGVSPLVVTFDEPDEGKLAALVSATEQFVLRRAP